MFPRNLQEAVEFYARTYGGARAVSLTYKQNAVAWYAWDVVYRSPGEVHPVTVTMDFWF